MCSPFGPFGQFYSIVFPRACQPTTGGMGTTLLYVGGSILVLLAVILLVTKRRMNAED